MKELTLLPEYWKGEIDYSKADVLVSKTGIYVLRFEFEDWFVNQHGAFERLANIEKFGGIKEAYVRERDELVRLKPEPRPADSIKLSECDGKHLVTGRTRSNKLFRVMMDGDHNVMIREIPSCFEGHNEASCFQSAVQLAELTDIKIFDMTQ